MADGRPRPCRLPLFLANRQALLYLEIQWSIPVTNVARVSRMARRFVRGATPLKFGSPDLPRSLPWPRRMGRLRHLLPTR